MRRINLSHVGKAGGSGRRRSQIPNPVLAPQAAVSDQERKKMKRKGDRYSMQTSLIVAALKRLLPIGLNICAPGDQELIALAKSRLSMVSACGGGGRSSGSTPVTSPVPPCCSAGGLLLRPSLRFTGLCRAWAQIDDSGWQRRRVWLEAAFVSKLS